jgi:hypothetical protein
MLERVVWLKFTDILEVLYVSIIRAAIALMVEAAGTSETSVNFYQTTRRNIPENSHVQFEQLSSKTSYGNTLIHEEILFCYLTTPCVLYRLYNIN